jgi:hypothetical protein
MDFERKLYVIRKRVGNAIRFNEVPSQFYDVHRTAKKSFPGGEYFYVTGLSFTDHDLQGHAHALPVGGILPRFSRSGL